MSDAQAQADEQLATAIRDHAAAYEIADSTTELLDSFGIIASWQKIEAGDGEHTYTVHYSSSYVPQHVAVGLFTVAVNIASLDNPGPEPGDDEQ